MLYDCDLFLLSVVLRIKMLKSHALFMCDTCVESHLYFVLGL